MAQPFRGHTALAEDPSSGASTHIKWLTTAGNSTSRVSEALVWPPQAPAVLHIYSHMNTSVYT